MRNKNIFYNLMDFVLKILRFHLYCNIFRMVIVSKIAQLFCESVCCSVMKFIDKKWKVLNIFKYS